MKLRSARARRKQVAPETTSSLVESTLRRLHLDDTVRGLRAMRAFGEAAGPRIGARARAERLRGRVLYVRVATSAWSQELHVLRSAILERMQKIPGGEEVDTLRFHVGEVDALPEWREEAAPAAAVPVEVAMHAPTELDGPLHAALSEITDEELRTRMTQMLERASEWHGAPAKSVSPRRS